MRRLTFVAGLVLATSAAFAQRLVTVNFAATDADGKAVTDLTAAEIQLTDQGKTAAIAAFRNESLRSPAGAREISNRPAPALARVQVILFDLLNLSLANRKPAIDQIARALEKAGTSESVYIYLLNLEGELAPVRPLPVTQAEATAAAAPWTREAAAMLDKAIGPVTVRPQLARDVVLRVQKTYEALAMLAGRMAGMPGRKNILWITFGVPCTLDVEGGQRWDCRSILGQVTDKLDLANVAVSPIAMQSAAADVESNNTLQQLVDSTGGKLYAGGDIERAIPDAIEVSRSSYRLQYAPPGAGWDGKAHKVRLSSTRKGVTLTAKQNYMATKTAAPVNERDRNLKLFQTAFDGADVGLNVTVTPGAQPHAVHLRIGIDVQDLLLTKEGDRFTGQLESYVAVYLSNNRVQEYPVLPINLALTAEQYAKMSKDGIHLGQDVLVPEGVKKIRLLLVDKAAGTSGSVTIPVM